MKKVKNLMVGSLIISFLTFNTAFSKDFDSGIISLGSSSTVIHADVKSERIPAGTMFQVRMETPVNSHNYFEGDTFRSTLLEDVRIGNLIVLPAGTLLRGRVGYAKSAGRFCRGGKLSLNFEHAVTPFGKQIPLAVETTKARNLTADGVFSAGGGYLNALDDNLDKSGKIITTTLDYSTNWGKSFWKGIPVVVTAPAGAFVGAFAGGSYFVTKSTYHMFKKGEDVKINPGDIIEVTLIEPLDVPTN
ncbi:MAG: hypothetical protein A2Y25_02940 [Candidatus Melainabacteria bacterium GWF2_37_15]|nr:MAG: hypothetical protein A2Y25_02940 [Candidatus Melainabacteria bacterium GWF2_37_15]